jgi:hypothetical protein
MGKPARLDSVSKKGKEAMRQMWIVVTTISLLTAAAGCHHGCNCGGGDFVADMGYPDTLAEVVTSRKWQPAFATPPAPLAEYPTSTMSPEGDTLPQPRRMPTGAPTVIDMPAQ